MLVALEDVDPQDRLAREAARLRKRFQLVKDKLRERLARARRAAEDPEE